MGDYVTLGFLLVVVGLLAVYMLRPTFGQENERAIALLLMEGYCIEKSSFHLYANKRLNKFSILGFQDKTEDYDDADMAVRRFLEKVDEHQ